MSTVVRNRIFPTLGSCLALSIFFNLAHGESAAPEAGIVLIASGQITAQTADHSSRTLTRRSPVFVGDKLVTAGDSQLQLRMKDGAIIAIGANAEFIIKAYSDDATGDKQDSAVLSLVQGGLRTISGSIDKSAYRLETPIATLGIRGTVFDVYVKGDGTTTVILRDGAVDVTGESGVIQKLDLPGLAVVVERGKPPTKPGPVPLDVLNYLRGFVPDLPDDITWQTNDDGSASFNIGDDIITIINTPPPMTTPDGSVPGEQAPPAVTPTPEPPPEEKWQEEWCCFQAAASINAMPDFSLATFDSVSSAELASLLAENNPADAAALLEQLVAAFPVQASEIMAAETAMDASPPEPAPVQATEQIPP